MTKPTPHPHLKHQAIRQARAKMYLQAIANRAAGLPWELQSIEVVTCEDGAHVMFYGNTGTDYWLTACEPYPVEDEDWSDAAWLAAFDAVAVPPIELHHGAAA